MPSRRCPKPLVAVLALALACACSVACVSNPGVDPPTNFFFFPTGVALDPLSSTLYVTQGNADIMYNGGTLTAVDLNEYHCRRTGTCPGTCNGGPCCVPDSRNPNWVDCEESLVRTDDKGDHPMIVGAVRMGGYAGQPVVNSSGTRLYVPVRGDPSVTFVELNRKVDGKSFDHMYCGGSPMPGDPPTCDSKHRVQGRGDILPVPGEPFSLRLDERQDLQQVTPTGENLAIELLYVSHLTSGEVSIFCAPPPTQIGDNGVIQDRKGEPPVLMYVVSNLFMPNTNMQFGTDDVIRQPFTETLYAVSRTNAYVATVGRYADLPLDNSCDPAQYQYAAGGQISLASLNNGSDARAIVFAPDGGRAFITERQPPSVVVLNTGAPGIGGSDRVATVAPIEVCDEPSTLMVRQLDTNTLYLYVICFADRSIFVIDPDLGAVVDSIQLPDGPNSLAMDPTTAAQPYGYVAGFRENTVGVIDLNPANPTFDQVIGLIGTPEVTQ
jgi:DNA-binding beta-propeller fold protein YncE